MWLGRSGMPQLQPQTNFSTCTAAFPRLTGGAGLFLENWSGAVSLPKLKRIRSGLYMTLNGRYEVERDEDTDYWVIRNRHRVPIAAKRTLAEAREAIGRKT